MRRVGLGLVLLAAGLAGCAPKALVAPEKGRPLDPVPLAKRLDAYNEGPRAVRVQGRLRVEGRGSADFGARVAEGVGFRLDAVAGPFATPVLALACRADDACRIYVPSRQTLYVDDGAGWAGWLSAFLRGRVPKMGEASGAWSAPGGGAILGLAGGLGWREEVKFAPGNALPERVTFLRDGRGEVEAVYGDYREIDGRPFPGRIAVRVREPRGGYELEFRRVEPETDGLGGALTLAVPPGTAVERLRGSPTWNATGIPFWLPRPDG